MHRQNAARRAIITWKNHFISVLSTKYSYFPIIECFQLLSQWFITLNLLHNSKFNPALSAYAYLYGPYDFNKYPMALPVTLMIFHKKTDDRISWVHCGTPGCYIGTALIHYRCMQCYMPSNCIVRITDTLQYIPKAFYFPKTTTEDYLQQLIG